MLISAENKRIEAVYPATVDGAKKCLCAIGGDALDFRGDGGLFRSETALYAAALSMSASNGDMLKENLTELGYEDISLSSFEGGREDKIGMAVAIKEEHDGATVAVILRPTVGREWYSNFEIGYGAEHAGFLKAAEYAEEKLSDRMFIRFPKNPPHFFVTGYSRGGAVANLLAKRLCDRWGLDLVRCYTFASPNTAITVRGARYSTIFNLVRDEDFFARVPLAGWGYTKYGNTLSLSSGDIKKRYRILAGEDYLGFSSSEEVDSFLGAVMKLAPNVHAYYERKYTVGDRALSLHDYMKTVAAILADEADETTADVLMGAMVSEFAGLSDFLSSGMDITAFLSPAQGIPKCSVADSHSPAAYMAALDAFLK